MNQFTKLLQEARSLIAGMNSQTRFLAALLVVAIAVSCGILISSAQSKSREVTFLFDGERFSDDELMQFELALSTAGLRDWKRVDGRMRIPEDKKADYYKAVSEAGAVPKGVHTELMSALKDTNFLENTRSIEAKHRQARIESIARSIEANYFVQSATVLADVNSGGFSSKKIQVASIQVTGKNRQPITKEQARNIIQFVQTSIAGLDVKDISLTDSNTGSLFRIDDDPISMEQDRFYQRKKQQEDDLKTRAQSLLAHYGNVRLEVNVELDPTLSEETSRMNYDPKSTTIQSATSRKDTENQKASPGGRPGTEPNALANRSASISQPPEQISKGKESTESTKQVVGSTLSTTKKAGLQTRQVSFSVMIPFSYYRTAFLGEWLQLNPGKTEADAPAFDQVALANTKQEVESNIKNVLSTIVQTATPGEDKQPNITVSHYVDIPSEPPVEIAMSAQAFGWLNRSWQTLMLGAVAIIAVLVLRSMAKVTPASSDTSFENGFDIPLDDALDIQLTGLDDDGGGSIRDSKEAEATLPRLRTTGSDLKTELTSMVRENPDAAATLLRNWIGGAQG